MNRLLIIVGISLLLVGCAFVDDAEEVRECKPPPCPPNASCLNLCGEIVRLDVQTGQEQNLTHQFGIGSLPVWSPDGSRLAFIGTESGTVGTLHVMNVDGTDRRRLTREIQGWSGALLPAWSPDGSRIAYVARTDVQSELRIVNVDGTGIRTLAGSPVATIAPPAWSPNGRRIAFMRVHDTAELHVVNVDDAREQRITRGLHVESYSWSPDGTRLVFSASTASGADLYIVELDDNSNQSILRPMVLPSPYNYHPVWSPDGSRIAYTAGSDGGSVLYTVRSDGTEPRNLTENPGQVQQPTWSPDGAFLAYSSFRDGASSDLYLIEATGDGERRLTNGPTSEMSPRWSPDGRWILFQR